MQGEHQATVDDTILEARESCQNKSMIEVMFTRSASHQRQGETDFGATAGAATGENRSAM